MNSRTYYPSFVVGEVKLDIECTTIGSGDNNIYISYLDNYLLENVAKITTVNSKLNKAYIMVPVCHLDKPI